MLSRATFSLILFAKLNGTLHGAESWQNKFGASDSKLLPIIQTQSTPSHNFNVLFKVSLKLLQHSHRLKHHNATTCKFSPKNQKG